MKKSIILAATLFGCFLFVNVAFAEDATSVNLPSSGSYWLIKAKEWLSINLFTFRASSKATVYDNYSQQRIAEMQYAVVQNKGEDVQISLKAYETQRTRAFNYAEKANDKAVMERIRGRTLEQQRAMTELQLKLDNNGELQQNIVRVQKEVATRAKNTVGKVEGEEIAAKMDQQTWVIWRDPNADINGNLPALPDNLEYAPGTTAGGEGGRVYQGGAGQIWAPGTSGGGSSSSTQSGNVVAPGTSGGEGGQTVEGDQNQNSNGATNGQSGQVVK